MDWQNIDKGKCVTYWNTAGAALVTQAEAAVKVNALVFLLKQEEQGRETSLEGRAALRHWHLAAVSGTPGREDGEGHQGSWHITTDLPFSRCHYYTQTICLLVLDEEVSLRVIRVWWASEVAVLQNNYKAWISLVHRDAHIQRWAHWQGDCAWWIYVSVGGVTEQRHVSSDFFLTVLWNTTFQPVKKSAFFFLFR